MEKKVGEKIGDFVIDEFLGKRRRAEEEQRGLPVLIEVVEDVSYESEQIGESRHVVSSALQPKTFGNKIAKVITTLSQTI